MMAKSMLDLNKVPDINSVFNKIDEITPQKIQELSRDNLLIDQMSSLAYLPE